jgi:hypothetical protein
MHFVEPVKQEDDLGCAVACVAFILNISYSEALELFADGKRRVQEEANFYCPELVKILNAKGLDYSWKKLDEEDTRIINNNLSIIFIGLSNSHPFGHFLARYKDLWMDPWINLPDANRKAGFREKLPGTPTYIIYLEPSSTS